MPLIRPVEQSLGFRPPEEPTPPPSWWKGERAADIPGGTMANPNVIHSWWRDIHERGAPYVVQLCCEDRIGGDKVFRTPTRIECRLKAEGFGDAATARRLAAALTEAADLLDVC